MARRQSKFERHLTKALARDRKRQATRKMRVSGKGVFTLSRLVDTKPRKRS